MSAGSTFAIVFLAVGILPAVVACWLFWQRRDVQPIKARVPELVVLADVVLILYIIALCGQRVAENDYPCLLNVWAAFLGTITLANAYLARVWILYFRYNLTQQQLLERPQGGSIVELSAAMRRGSFDAPSNFFFRWRRFTTNRVLMQIGTVVTLVLVAPAAALSFSDKVRDTAGDSCDREWGDILLAVYVGFYIVLFLVFSFRLRQAMDGFFIKAELRATGVVGILAVVPWFLFNNQYEDINNDVFPFSTLALVLAAYAAIITSTMVPLYRSYKGPSVLVSELTKITSLRALLKHRVGHIVFKRFLISEFSVENLLFYDEVEALRHLQASITRRRSSHSFSSDETYAINDPRKNGRASTVQDPLQAPEVKAMVLEIYLNYVVPNSAFWVNLPADIVDNISHSLHNLYGGVDQTPGYTFRQRPKASPHSSSHRKPRGRSFRKSAAVSPAPPTQVAVMPGPQASGPVQLPNPGSVHLAHTPASAAVEVVAVHRATGTKISHQLSDSSSSGQSSLPSSRRASNQNGNAAVSSILQTVMDAFGVSNDDEELLPTIFDAAQDNIFRLMETDSFMRFLDSSVFQGFLADLQAQAGS